MRSDTSIQEQLRAAVSEPVSAFGRLGIGLVVAGALTVSAGFVMSDGAAGSGAPPSLDRAAVAGANGGAPPQAPLDPTAAPTQTPEPTATLEPPSPTPEPPTPVPSQVPPRATATPRPVQPTQPPAQPPAPPAAPAVALVSLEQELYNLHNVERGRGGLGSLRLDPTLEAIAKRRAQDMASKNYFSHTSPSGETAFSIMAAYGYSYSIAGENIARNNYPDEQSASTAMTGFMNSPSHRANIMDARYTSVGVALAYGADGMKYFAVVFAGKP